MFHFQVHSEVHPNIFPRNIRSLDLELFLQTWSLLLLHSPVGIFLQWWWCWQLIQDILGRRFLFLQWGSFWFEDFQPKSYVSIFWSFQARHRRFLLTWRIFQPGYCSRFPWGWKLDLDRWCWRSFRSRLHRSQGSSYLLPFGWGHHPFCSWGRVEHKAVRIHISSRCFLLGRGWCSEDRFWVRGFWGNWGCVQGRFWSLFYFLYDELSLNI